MSAAKRRTTPKKSPRKQEEARRSWTWDEVLDAALTLDHCDFLAVLSEMLLVRFEKEQLARQRYSHACRPSDIPFDDPLEDDFLDVPAAIPLEPRRGKKRKR